MDEKNKLTDEQLAGVSGGYYYNICNGLTLDEDNPETYLAFAEAERSTGTFSAFNVGKYFRWYQEYYGETHSNDER